MEFSPVNIESRKKMDIKVGDTVRVAQKIQEKGKTRLQNFEGMVLAKKHGTEPGATFTVRRVDNGFGVEKIFPLFSPIIDNVEVIKRSKVRRAKLYYIRKKAAKELSKRMKMAMMSLSFKDEEKVEEDSQGAEQEEQAEEMKEEKSNEESENQSEQTTENNEEENK